MGIKAIFFIDSLDYENQGIWQPIVNSAKELNVAYQIETEIWAPPTKDKEVIETLNRNLITYLSVTNFSKSNLKKILSENKLDKKTTVIVSHGCWQFPTKWASFLAKNGFCWIFVPHGMLEPWSLRQKKYLKAIYFKIFEYPKTSNANVVRAVSSPEYQRLNKLYSQAFHLPTGIQTLEQSKIEKPKNILNFLFISRLHHKKGVVPLLKAWIASKLSENENVHLTIAGPDQGEKQLLSELLSSNPKISNVTLLDKVVGKEKEDLLLHAHVFVLPSFSEGFPGSLLEGMTYGSLPVFTKGCNFPEAEKFGYVTSTEIEDIKNTLETVYNLPLSEIIEKGRLASQFINLHYSIKEIARKESELYTNILNKKNKTQLT